MDDVAQELFEEEKARVEEIQRQELIEKEKARVEEIQRQEEMAQYRVVLGNPNSFGSEEVAAVCAVVISNHMRYGPAMVVKAIQVAGITPVRI